MKKTLGSSSIATTDKRFHRPTPNLTGGGDVRGIGVRLRGSESGYADKHRARQKGRKTSMAVCLNQKAVEHEQNLIKGHQYERNSDWSEVQPSAEEEN